jgi:anti-sigma factor RsiW
VSDLALTCRELVELVSDYFELALDDGDLQRFEAHLASCGACTLYVGQLRLTLDAIRALRRDALDEPTHTALARLFEGWKENAAP